MKVRAIRKQAQKHMKRNKQFVWAWCNIETMSGWAKSLYQIAEGFKAMTKAVEQITWTARTSQEMDAIEASLGKKWKAA